MKHTYAHLYRCAQFSRLIPGTLSSSSESRLKTSSIWQAHLIIMASILFFNVMSQSSPFDRRHMASSSSIRAAPCCKIQIQVVIYQCKKVMLFFEDFFSELWQKIQQTKILVTCQRFDDLFLFRLVWQYFSVQRKHNKGRFKVMATYLQPTFIHCTLLVLIDVCPVQGELLT